MVTLTRITGTQFALNPDLIERVDRTPDTVITLVDGTKYLVREGLDEVIAAILDYRARVLASASLFERVGDSTVRRGRLSAVPTLEDDVDRNAPEPEDEDEAGEETAETPADLAVAHPVLPLTPRNS